MEKPKVANVSLEPAEAERILPDERYDLVRRMIRESIETKEKLAETCVTGIVQVAATIVRALVKGRKVLLFGNGGSAADAQHFAAELVGKFRRPRQGLRAMALTANTSLLTALGNDFGFDEVYARQVKAYCENGDIVIGISTSGKSKNVLRGIEEGHSAGATTIGLTGQSGGELAEICDLSIRVPSDDAQRIQESHNLVNHIVCELVEKMLAG